MSLGVKVVVDLIPGRATLGGVYTGLHFAAHDRVFAAASDMPWLSPAAIRVVLDQALSGDIVIPEPAGRHQPMHAVYANGRPQLIHSFLIASTIQAPLYAGRR